MKAITDWINSHKALTVCIAFFLLIVQPFLVHVVLLIPAPYKFMITDLKDGELLTYVAGFEAFIGTVFLGIVATRQNDKANETNEKLVSIQENQSVFERQPSLMITNWRFQETSLDEINNHPTLPIIPYDDIRMLQDGQTIDGLYLLVLKLTNASKIYTEFSLVRFYLINLKIDRLITTYSRTSTSTKQDRFHVLASNEIELGFVLNSSMFKDDHKLYVYLELKLLNSIGESFIEKIHFQISRYNTLTIDGYHIDPSSNDE